MNTGRQKPLCCPL